MAPKLIVVDEACRRSACDRCRRQKLRCVRAAPDEPCERCRKSRSDCCTSHSTSRLCPGASSSSGSLQIGQLSSHASSTGSGNLERTNSLASVNIFNDGQSQSGGSHMGVTMSGPDLNMSSQGPMQSLEGFPNSPNTTQNELWEELDLSSLTQTPSTFGCFDNMIIDEIFQTPTLASSSDGSSRSASSSQTPMRISNGDRRGNESLDNVDMLRSKSQYQQFGDVVTMYHGRIASEHSSRHHTRSASSEGIKLYTTQILDSQRRSTRKADEYIAMQRLAPETSVNMRRSSTESRAAASRHFIESLFSDSQAFLRILHDMQACVRSSATPIDRADWRKHISHAADSLGSCLGGQDGMESSSKRSSNDHIVGTQTLDFQSSLTIISYYAHIIQAYDTVFQDILSLMTEHTASEDLAAILPHYMPDVYVGSVRLLGQPRLQLKSLLNASSAILEDIENGLGLGSIGSSNGLFQGAQTQSLLDALLNQSDLAYEKADGTREARVKQTINRIHRILDSILV